MFGARFSRRVARRYRGRGLDKTAKRIVAYLADRGVSGASVLEIGGGVGEIQLELLRRGASRATNLELVDSYDVDAAELAAEAGMSQRVTRRNVDLALTPDAVAAHDVVILHRVVCCYPDYERLLTAAADHASRFLIFSHPPRNWLARMLFRIQNAGFRLRGMSFRIYAHPPKAMEAVARGRGLQTDFRYRGPIWQMMAFAR
jgi:2-polyprenyl-3-methyl-5-hydroxy-6-metoxy-1,4-benzoquinol methylase